MALGSEIVSLQKKAQEQKRRFEWLEAARSYEQVLRSTSKNVQFAAENWQNIGYCYNLASRQAEKIEEFEELRQSAVDAYRIAAKLYGDKDTLNNLGQSALCSATAECLRIWLVSNPSKKKEAFDECNKFGNKALQEFKKVEDESNQAKTYINLLSMLFDQIYIASTEIEKQTIAQQGVSYSEEAISALSKLDNTGELLQVYSQASLLNWYFANISEKEEERKENADRSLRYSEKALKLSEEVDNPYFKARSRWAATLSTIFFSEEIETSLQHAKEMLQHGVTVNDNYLKGVASYLLAFVTDWMVTREDNPDEKKERCHEILGYAKDAIKYLQLVSQNFIIAETYQIYSESYFSLANDFLIDPSEKIAYLQKAVDVGRKGSDHAALSGSPDAIGSTYHALSKVLHSHSKLEPEKSEKIKLLEEALGYRKWYIEIVEKAFPSNYWVTGVGKTYKAQIEADLARLETNKEKKKNLFQNSISDIREGVSDCNKWISFRPVPTLIAAVAEFEDAFGEILSDAYLLTQEQESLTLLMEVYEDAAEKFRQVNLPCRAAECHWKIARIQDQDSNHKDAAQKFEEASTYFQTAAQKTPRFKNFYQDYASYMKTWSEIELAKLSHKQEDYAASVQHYQKAAKLIESTNRWRYLGTNFLAWAHVEKAEETSRKEQTREAIDLFKQARELFEKSKETIENHARAKKKGIRDREELDMANELSTVSKIRQQYCSGRMSIEEAKILDREGNHLASSRKYSEAAEILNQVADAEPEPSRREILHIYWLCKGWEMMSRAESEVSPELYSKASDFFSETRKYASNEKTITIALGHSNFCKALESGTKFEETREKNHYSSATRYLDSAENYYLKAGFNTASDYTKATQRLFDSLILIDTAKSEINPENKVKYYLMAEKTLQTAAGSYLKAKHPEKMEKVQRLLKRIQEERELAVSLSDILHAPDFTSSTLSFVTPNPTHEKAVGLESFEHADVQAEIIASPNTINVGGELTIDIELLNTGKAPALLTRIEDLLPQEFEIVQKPRMYRVENGDLNMRGKKLDPHKTEEVRLILKPFRKGVFNIQPKIQYMDDTNQDSALEIEPLTINVEEMGIFGWLRGPRTR